MKVLVAVDGSADGFEAVRQAGRLLSPLGDKVALYFTPPEVRDPRAAPEILDRARQALADAVFNEARAKLPAELQTGVETVLGVKPPRSGVLLAADEWRADMIVVGARGAGPMEKLLLGSVSRSVVHGSHVPVLVVRAVEGRAAEGPLRVLLACDGSQTSRHAAEILGRFTWPSGTTCRVITVIESLLVGTVPKWLEDQARSADADAMAQAWVREHEADKQHHQEELARYCGTLPGPFQTATPIVAEGYPAEQILHAIASESIDLVVVGAHGKGALARLLMGSTSQKVLDHAPCSVLVVREHAAP
jgi:nucleotide-binding universal stress UspA family protein